MLQGDIGDPPTRSDAPAGTLPSVASTLRLGGDATGTVGDSVAAPTADPGAPRPRRAAT